MKRTYVLGVIVIAGAVVAAAANLAAQQPAAGGQGRQGGRGGGPALGKIEKVADNLYFIFGNGGNTGRVPGGKGCRAGRYQAPEQRAGHPRPGEVGHR